MRQVTQSAFSQAAGACSAVLDAVGPEEGLE